MKKPITNHLMTFEERNAIGKEILAKQPLISYEQALEQVNRLKNQSKIKEEFKKRSSYSSNTKN